MPAGFLLLTCVLNIQFNAILNLDCEKPTELVAYAYDVILSVKAGNIREAENLTYLEMGKITRWAKINKINYNEKK